MSKTSKEIQSEFDQKLRESMALKQDDTAPLPPATEDDRQGEVIPVIEEQLHIGKQVVETGRVRLSKTVREEDVMVDTPVAHEEISVARIAINKPVDAAPDIRYEGDTTIIPVMREEAVVVKRLVLVEELHVTRRIVRTQQQQQVTLRKEEIIVNREETGQSGPE